MLPALVRFWWRRGYPYRVSELEGGEIRECDRVEQPGVAGIREQRVVRASDAPLYKG